VICVALTTETLEIVMSGLLVATTAPETKFEPFNVTFTVVPCTPLLGVNEVRFGPAESTLTLAVTLPLPYVAINVTDVATGTVVVAIVNGALVDPAAMLTLPGTEATLGFELDKATTTPPCGAGPFRLTVAPTLFPPCTLPGAATLLNVGGYTPNGRVMAVKPSVAVIFALVIALTAVVDMLKVADVVPAGTVTDGGGEATDEAELDSATFRPAGAGAIRETSLLVAVNPPVTLPCVASQEIVTGFNVSIAVAVAVE
jgi:hypothetical protein